MSKQVDLTMDLKITYDGDPWHGPSIINVLNNMTDKDLAKMVSEEHTIRQVLLHMLTWRMIVAARLRQQGDPPELIDQEMNFPVDKASLQDIANRFEQTQSTLINVLSTIPEEILDHRIAGKQHTFRQTISGLTHHDLYHLGQIVISLNRN